MTVVIPPPSPSDLPDRHTAKAGMMHMRKQHDVRRTPSGTLLRSRCRTEGNAASMRTSDSRRLAGASFKHTARLAARLKDLLTVRRSASCCGDPVPCLHDNTRGRSLSAALRL